MEVGTIEYIATIDTSQYKKGADTIKSENDQMEKSGSRSTGVVSKGFMALGTVAKGAAIGGVAALAVAIGKNIPGAIKRVDTLVAFPRVLQAMGATGEEAATATNKLSKQLQGLPTPLQEGAAGVQALVAAGLGVQEATDTFLAFNNATLAASTETGAAQGAFTQLTQAISKGKIEGQEWNSIIAATPTAFQALSKESGLTREQLRELYRENPEKLLKDLVRLDKEGGGGLASLEEQARAATGGIGTAFANLNTGIQRGMENIVRAIGGGDLEAGQRKISKIIGDIGKTIGDGLVAVGNGLASAIKYFQENEVAMQLLKGAAIGLGVALLASLAPAIWGVVTAIGAAAVAAAPFVIAGAAIAGIALIIRKNWEKISPVIDKVKEVFSIFWNAIKPIRDFIANQFKKAWDDLKGSFNSVMESLRPFLPQLKILGVIIGVGLLVPTLALIAAIGLFVAAIVLVVTVVARLIGWFSKLIAWIVDLQATSNKFASEFATKIGGAVSSVWDRIRSVFGNIGGWFRDRFTDAKNRVVGILNGIISYIGSIPGKITGAFKNVGAGIAFSIKSALNSILKLPLTIPKVSVGGKSVGGQTLIPRLAEGGIVTSATLAVVGEGGEPEAVIPLSKLDKMLSRDASDGGGGITNNIQNVTISSEVDGERWLRRLSGDQEIVSNGLVPTQSYM